MRKALLEPYAVSLACTIQLAVVSVKGEVTNQPPSGQALWEKSQQPVGPQMFACLGALAPGPEGQLYSCPLPRGSGPKWASRTPGSPTRCCGGSYCSKNSLSGREDRFKCLLRDRSYPEALLQPISR